MSYKAGDLQVVLAGCPDDDGWCSHNPEHQHVPYDSRDGVRHAPAAYLPHSCDSWVIGNPKAIRALIADLQAALVQMGSE